MSKRLAQWDEYPEWVNYDPNDGKYIEDDSVDFTPPGEIGVETNP